MSLRNSGTRFSFTRFQGPASLENPRVPTLEEHAQEAYLLMKELGIDEVHIIGTSYGGEVALRFAIDFPDTVKSISIIDSVSELDEVLKLFVRGWKNAAKGGNPKKFFWDMVPTIYGDSLH